LPPAVRAEIEAVVEKCGGLVRYEDFDDGVIHQLTSKRSEAEALEAVRSIRQYELSNIQHMAAYINHVIKHYNPTAGESGTAGSGMVSCPKSLTDMLSFHTLPLIWRCLETIGQAKRMTLFFWSQRSL
jgi:hypothetical protein